MHIMQSRRDFLASLAAAGAAGVLDGRGALADEGPPEITSIRLARDPSLCLAPGYIADDLLRAEGFIDIRYVPTPHVNAVADGVIDFAMETAPWVVSHVAAGQPITALAGIHSGCYELFAHEPIHTVSDLKGRKVGVPERVGSSGHLLLMVMTAQVGLDPHEDIDWVIDPSGDFMAPFMEGQVDAFLRVSARTTETAGPQGRPRDPEHGHGQAVVGLSVLPGSRPPGVRARPSDRHEALSSCRPQGRRRVRRRPGARRAPAGRCRLCRAIRLRASDPDLSPIRRWREFDAEDTLRFYALRLHEVGMITSTPGRIIAEGADWSFLHELKRELKA